MLNPVSLFRALRAHLLPMGEGKSALFPSRRGRGVPIYQYYPYSLQMAGDKKLNFAKHMRRNQTPAEDILWQKLRAKRLGGYKFRRQVPLGKYVVEFVCESQKLIIEIDGESHVDSGEYDAERTAVLENFGYQVLRFWNPDVYAELDAVLDTIILTLENAKP